MKRIYLIPSLIILLVSCNNAEKKVTKQPKEETVKIDETIIAPENISGVEPFEDFPEEIDGPGCSFSFTKKEYLKGGRYVYADDLDSICYLKIKGEFVRFKLVDYKRDTLFNTYSKRFKNDNYQLSIDLKKVEEIDEANFFKGSMLLKHEDHPAEKKDLYGVCGC